MSHVTHLVLSSRILARWSIAFVPFVFDDVSGARGCWPVCLASLVAAGGGGAQRYFSGARMIR